MRLPPPCARRSGAARVCPSAQVGGLAAPRPPVPWTTSVLSVMRQAWRPLACRARPGLPLGLLLASAGLRPAALVAFAVLTPDAPSVVCDTGRVIGKPNGKASWAATPRAPRCSSSNSAPASHGGCGEGRASASASGERRAASGEAPDPPEAQPPSALRPGPPLCTLPLERMRTYCFRARAASLVSGQEQQAAPPTARRADPAAAGFRAMSF